MGLKNAKISGSGQSKAVFPVFTVPPRVTLTERKKEGPEFLVPRKTKTNGLMVSINQNSRSAPPTVQVRSAIISLFLMDQSSNRYLFLHMMTIRKTITFKYWGFLPEYTLSNISGMCSPALSGVKAYEQCQ